MFDEDPYDQTCAIVGSSGIVLNYEDGAAIDAHDMVFRFNSAPTKGYALQASGLWRLERRVWGGISAEQRRVGATTNDPHVSASLRCCVIFRCLLDPAVPGGEGH
jgi:hypothetical protein